MGKRKKMMTRVVKRTRFTKAGEPVTTRIYYPVEVPVTEEQVDDRDQFLKANNLALDGSSIRTLGEIEAGKKESSDPFLRANKLDKDGNPLPAKEGEEEGKPKFGVNVLGRVIPV